MKLRAIGTGHPYCRHPLIPPAFLLQTDGANLLIGCPYQIAAKLETIGVSSDKIDMILLLGLKGHQAGGIEELASLAAAAGNTPMLVAPASLIELLKKRLLGLIPQPLEHYFTVRATQKVTIQESEHCSETLTFLSMKAPDYSKNFALRLEEARILITGETDDMAELWSDELTMILKDGLYYSDGQSKEVTAIAGTMPLYVQQKIWLYGYPDNHQELVDPIPMLHLPQGACVYDSNRKDKYFEKERYLRENAKRKQGNTESG